jgi:hypothetical protein
MQCDIVDRFDTAQETLLFLCMLCLADREGRVKMDAATLAARIRWKLDTLEDTLDLLMRENPASKCKKLGGRCVAFFDPVRPHLGFVIPAAVTHRKRNADTERRRAYRRAWMKAKRPSRAKKVREHGVNRGEHGVNSGELPPPSKVNRGEHGVNKGEHEVNCDRDRDRDYKEECNGAKGDITKGAHKSLKASSDPDLIYNVDEILELICEKVYDNLVRKNQVGQDTVRMVAEMLPFSRKQIDLVADYLTFPAEDCFPELKKRRPLAFNQLIRWWGDQVSVAVMFDQKYFQA